MFIKSHHHSQYAVVSVEVLHTEEHHGPHSQQRMSECAKCKKFKPQSKTGKQRSHLAIGLAALLSHLGDHRVGQQIIGNVCVRAAQRTECQALNALCCVCVCTCVCQQSEHSSLICHLASTVEKAQEAKKEHSLCHPKRKSVSNTKQTVKCHQCSYQVEAVVHEPLLSQHGVQLDLVHHRLVPAQNK